MHTPTSRPSLTMAMLRSRCPSVGDPPALLAPLGRRGTVLPKGLCRGWDCWKGSGGPSGTQGAGSAARGVTSGVNTKSRNQHQAEHTDKAAYSRIAISPFGSKRQHCRDYMQLHACVVMQGLVKPWLPARMMELQQGLDCNDHARKTGAALATEAHLMVLLVASQSQCQCWTCCHSFHAVSTPQQRVLQCCCRHCRRCWFHLH